ncbi:MAG: 4'-phosphopantetheinyl transferase superfamily protein, partial [Alphaproteobacteria bacterium]
MDNKKNLIWMVSIDENLKKNYLPFISILSTDEIQRYHRYKDKKAQYTFLVSHISLRLILGKSYDVHPKKLVFEFNEYGKPYLRRIENLHFNLSHSTKRACIIESDVEVGIDIECIRDFNYEEISSSFFSDDECLKILQQQNKKQKLINFFEIWTQKEALLKCIG